MKVEFKKNIRRSLLNYKDKATIKNCKNFPRGGKKLASYSPGGSICHLIPHHGYGPGFVCYNDVHSNEVNLPYPFLRSQKVQLLQDNLYRQRSDC